MKRTNSKVTRNEIDQRVEYVKWLCYVGGLDNFGPRHMRFAWELYQKNFYPLVGNDDNRCADGKELRGEYAQAMRLHDVHFLNGPCSVFEALVGIARRMEYIISLPYETNPVARWFLLLIKNLNLHFYDDEDICSMDIELRNDYILTKWLERDYDGNGKGGIFPLNRPREDQRRIEIWSQMHAYLDENYPI